MSQELGGLEESRGGLKGTQHCWDQRHTISTLSAHSHPVYTQHKSIVAAPSSHLCNIPLLETGRMRLIQNMCTISECPPAASTDSAGTSNGSSRVIKIAVIGGSGVGKTALVVRFLTKRFIGDYERNAGNLYSRQVQIDGMNLAIQVQDTPGVQIHEQSLECNEQLNRSIRWADAVVIVFSITDCKSYELINHLHQYVRQLHPDNRVPIVIVANKADLLHLKQVEPQHGLQLANMLGCTFYEVSVSENYIDVYNAFQVLCKEISKHQATSTPEKRKNSLIPRPKSPNMQDLKRRFKQVLSAKVRTATSV